MLIAVLYSKSCQGKVQILFASLLALTVDTAEMRARSLIDPLTSSCSWFEIPRKQTPFARIRAPLPESEAPERVRFLK